MVRRTQSWFWPAAIGLGVGLVFLAVASIGPTTVGRMQVAVSDFVFLADNGPRFGRQSAASNIVLVLFDQRSASSMTALPTVEQDIALYKSLLDGGASVVADTRMLADAGHDPTVNVEPMLQAMAELNAGGRLVRDVWTPVNWPAEKTERYRPLIAHNLVNMHPNADGATDARLYPLVTLASDGMHESMPLIISRRIRGLESPTMDEVLAQVKQSGIAAAWHVGVGEQMTLPDQLRADDVAAGPYPFVDLQIPWHAFPSKAPLIPPVGYWISYAAPPSAIERVSYSDAADASTEGKFRDKIVLVGYDAAIDPTADTYVIPSDSHRAAAAEVVAAAIHTLLEPRLTLMPPAWLIAAAVVVMAVVAAMVGGVLKPLGAAAGVIGLLALYFTICVIAFRSGWMVDLVLAPAAMLTAGGLGAGYRYWGEAKARARIVDLFGRYVPKAVVTQLMQRPDAEALAVGGVKRDVTVLFADIRGFTPFAERFPPEEVLVQLNALLQIMVDCTFAEEGTVDKFIGDAILVLFNAPLDQPDHVQRAARTAWAIQQGLNDHDSGLAVGIGIHRGEAVVGTVGTPQRMEYTAVGSTVNVASRLCSAAGGGEIVISDAAAQSLDGQFQLAPQSPIQVKGVAEPLATSLLTGPHRGESDID